MTNRWLLCALIPLATAGCSLLPGSVETAAIKRGQPLAQLHPSRETEPVQSLDDAADDPAIWVNSADPLLSRVLGTDKQFGLLVYNLDGQELQAIDAGLLNNVDLRQGVRLNGVHQDVAAATNRTANTLDIFSIEAESGHVSLVGRQALALNEPYGTCMYLHEGETAYVFVNDKDGRYQQWRLDSLRPLRLELVREFAVATQPEGCAADDLRQSLFVGEEGTGVWRFSAAPDANDSRIPVDWVGAGVLVADVEGMDLYRVDAHTAYLLVSSQGDFSYAVYSAEQPYEYLGSFVINDNLELAIDGSEETDGLAVSNRYLGPEFPAGLVVVQDGFNRNPSESQNFKYLSWELLAQALGLQSASGE